MPKVMSKISSCFSGTWTTPSGAQLTDMTLFGPNEPNNHLGNEDCLVIDLNYQLNDVNCDDTRAQSVCIRDSLVPGTALLLMKELNFY